MRLPVLEGVIERRLLVNYRVDPDALAAVLPEPFRPQLVRGHGVAGICLIRLGRVRPRALPLPCGLRSENAAHRVAVTWDDGGAERAGVWIPRRDTDSRLSAVFGGRLFPGEHHRARFAVDETDGRYAVSLRSADGEVDVHVAGRVTDALPADSVFADLAEASAFFEHGGLGWSATRDPGRFDTLELACEDWAVEALQVDAVRSSYFDDIARFPAGAAVFDHALLMRDIRHAWHAREDLCCVTA